MKRYLIALMLLPSAALAQQVTQPPADIKFMQKSIAAIQAQRNEALDAQAWLDAKASTLTDENAALAKQIDDLTKKAEENAALKKQIEELTKKPDEPAK